MSSGLHALAAPSATNLHMNPAPLPLAVELGRRSRYTSRRSPSPAHVTSPGSTVSASTWPHAAAARTTLCASPDSIDSGFSTVASVDGAVATFVSPLLVGHARDRALYCPISLLLLVVVTVSPAEQLAEHRCALIPILTNRAIGEEKLLGGGSNHCGLRNWEGGCRWSFLELVSVTRQVHGRDDLVLLRTFYQDEAVRRVQLSNPTRCESFICYLCLRFWVF